MSKEYARTQRVAKLLKEEIARLLQREVKDVRVGMVTVSDVDVTRDLKYATVYVQVPGDAERKDQALEGLASAAGFMRSRLGRELRVRRVPELRFEVDETQERAMRIHELLTEIEDGDVEDEGES
jgi:ribosome-binding factor A